jgi:hypothetical protein
MDINRIPKAGEITQASETNQTSESSASSETVQPDPAGFAEPDQIQQGSALNPYLAMFETPTLNAEIPGQSAPLAEAGIPDKLASVDPRQNLPDGAKAQSLNIPGTEDLKMAPDHFGIDLSTGGIRSNDVIADALGIGKEDQATPQPGGEDSSGLQADQLSHLAARMTLYADGEGTETPADVEKKKSLKDEIVETAYKVVDKTMEAIDYIDMLWKAATAPVTVKEVTGDPTDLLRGVKAFGTGDSGDALLKKVDEGNKYIDPEGGSAVQTNFTTEDFLRIQNIRQGVNTMPSNVDDPQPINIDPDRAYDPMSHPLVTDGNPEFDSQISADPNLDVRNNTTGGDTSNEDLAPPPKPPDQ